MHGHGTFDFFPGGKIAISRAVERSDTPGNKPQGVGIPAGMLELWLWRGAQDGLLKVRFEDVVGSVPSATPAGVGYVLVGKSGGVASLNPRLMAAKPPALEVGGWNVPTSGSAFVMKFEVDAGYLTKFTKECVGSKMHRELWVPAGELEEFNRRIVGPIQITRSFPEPEP